MPALFFELGDRFGDLADDVPSTERSDSSEASRGPAFSSVRALTRWLSTEPAWASVESRRERSSTAFSSRASARTAQLPLNQQDRETAKGDGSDGGFDGREGQAEICGAGNAEGGQAR